MAGVSHGFNQLRLTLIVSRTGEVIDADASGDPQSLKFWPELQDEVRQWKFTPLEKDGRAVTAELEEYIDLVPAERLPTKHVTPPEIHLNSTIGIALERTGCFGSCPSYSVKITKEKIQFDGSGFVVAYGKHMDKVDAAEFRKLAKKFVASDFYSMDPKYLSAVTDNPTYVLSIDIDGRAMKVMDYVGSWEGMPAIITELENDVDEFAQTNRWIDGDDGLVDALRDEKYNFHTFDAQVMLKEAATRGKTSTVTELIDAGVPLRALRGPHVYKAYEAPRFQHVGWLTAAAPHTETLQALMQAGAGNNNQNDKDLALASAARAGNLQSVHALIAYGANPNADLSKLTVSEDDDGMTLEGDGAGSLLIYAAASGNPEMVREFLRYHPDLEARDPQGKTALFSATEYRSSDEDGARVECVRLLAQAGANVNARDRGGNTPLHETFLTDVEEELLKLGADVNARNDDGETPIFTTVDNEAIPLFIKYGADLSIRNKKGETVFEAAKEHGPQREEALRKAVEQMTQR